jgi:hypothetical protein
MTVPLTNSASEMWMIMVCPPGPQQLFAIWSKHEILSINSSSGFVNSVTGRPTLWRLTRKRPLGLSAVLIDPVHGGQFSFHSIRLFIGTRRNRLGLLYVVLLSCEGALGIHCSVLKPQLLIWIQKITMGIETLKYRHYVSSDEVAATQASLL